MASPLRDQLQISFGDSYAIERELGGGGMSRVFLAEETALARKVVIKVLPPEATALVSADRFRREISLAARLQHPHVVPLMQAGEVGGLLYYTMPYIEGDSLRARLERGPLAVNDAIAILRDVARALEFAHGRGVVHRDIKPENVLLAGNAATVTDFGIAKAVDASLRTGGDRETRDSRGGTLTQLGVTLGTPAYMAPEQVVGDPDVDHRADIYSFGCMAYELLAGRSPFHGLTTSALLAAHVARPPTPVREKAPDLPPALAELVMRCLAKDPAERPQSAAELTASLGGVSTIVAARASAEVESIVVVPFADVGPGPGDDYLALGVTEEIIADLSGIDGLRVIARTSAMRLKGTDKDARTIGRELGVRYLLDGSVRRAGHHIRIAAQLVDTTTESLVWGDKFEGTVEEAFAIQERLSRAVAEVLRVRLDAEDQERMGRRPAGGVRAFECFVRARHEIYRSAPDALERADRLVESGLRAGESALLVAARAQIMVARVAMGMSDDAEQLGRAERMVDRALALDEALPVAHLVRGVIRLTRGDVQEGVRSLKRTLAIAPDDPDALAELSRAYGMAGRVEDARAMAERLAQVDPLTPYTHALRGWPHVLEGRAEAALPHYERMNAMDPESPLAGFYHGVVLAYDRRQREAARVLERVAAAAAASAPGTLARAYAHALLGDAAVAAAAITPELLRAAPHVEWIARELAHVYALAGRTDDALRWLGDAIRLGFFNHPFLAVHDRLLDGVRGARGFDELLARARQRADAFEA